MLQCFQLRTAMKQVSEQGATEELCEQGVPNSSKSKYKSSTRRWRHWLWLSKYHTMMTVSQTGIVRSDMTSNGAQVPGRLCKYCKPEERPKQGECWTSSKEKARGSSRSATLQHKLVARCAHAAWTVCRFVRVTWAQICHIQ